MAKCAIEQGAPAPGQHGARRGRKMSEFGQQLRQKQSLRRQFGMQELQFKRFFKEALRRKGVTGEILLQLLETRMDNLVYRLGFAASRRSARQFVLHGHMAVNGKTVAIPSMILKVGDVVEVRDRPRSRDFAMRSLEAATTQQTPSWLSLDKKAFRAEILSLPTREQIAPVVDEQAIVELYSR
jgi:small subunit ribosomal protein S4